MRPARHHRIFYCHDSSSLRALSSPVYTSERTTSKTASQLKFKLFNLFISRLQSPPHTALHKLCGFISNAVGNRHNRTLTNFSTLTELSSPYPTIGLYIAKSN